MKALLPALLLAGLGLTTLFAKGGLPINDACPVDGKAGRVIPTMAREVFDVSGAGDTSIAALTLGLAAGAVLEEAAQFANAAAGVVVGKLGTATVTPAELTAYVSASA